MTTISVIVGSTRQGRFSEKPAQWILQHLKSREGIEAKRAQYASLHLQRLYEKAQRLVGAMTMKPSDVSSGW